jgi:hypothetical protein
MHFDARHEQKQIWMQQVVIVTRFLLSRFSLLFAVIDNIRKVPSAQWAHDA